MYFIWDFEQRPAAVTRLSSVYGVFCWNQFRLQIWLGSFYCTFDILFPTRQQEIGISFHSTGLLDTNAGENFVCTNNTIFHTRYWNWILLHECSFFHATAGTWFVCTTDMIFDTRCWTPYWRMGCPQGLVLCVECKAFWTSVLLHPSKGCFCE